MARHILHCDTETLSKDLSAKTYIVTGANSGVGLETTRQLVKQGAHVVMACRRVAAGEAEAQSFAGLAGTYEVSECDLADLASVRGFVNRFLASHSRLDGLMCNAGMVAMGNAAAYTKDGFESTIGVSYFGHFLMIEMLLDTLKASAPSRIGLLSSVVHAGNPKNRYQVNLEDLNWKTRKYNAFTAYGEAKVANVLYAMELADRLQGTGVTTASIHPGWARSNFGGNGLLMRVMRVLMKPFQSRFTDSNETSAQTSLHVLLSDDAPNHNGAYFSQSSVLYRDPGCKDGGWPLASPNPHATDMTAAKALVAKSYGLVGLTAG
ncbi:3-oxoacyl-[acyl-carrier-protein] reductase FabG [Tritonibacter multivorans]|uniref:3-oxoacyl-[acyl-carrier-protein] reductase FabG n=1 Tax=Tritonibacter multivorans TaxID=928856 RepID=A0A0P1GIE1_9RHOB|nr:SDR family NAD(P)-dependent oxidoreductase [Tritonibacter multivorans]MDA7420504.1 SDR family NAD(P)-dependent oxidoreductase [Tritonibacter multivorans]CUH81468.1 3-oxoacyl-[acyl-carrier-protein] reductase FabG [Tritonibacter multivorans]SFC36050.1 retinol dehydrogenase-13 [Tritonibacter multivorans]